MALHISSTRGQNSPFYCNALSEPLDVHKRRLIEFSKIQQLNITQPIPAKVIM